MSLELATTETPGAPDRYEQRRALMPQDYREVISMADQFGQSGMFAVKNAAQAYVVLMTGMEMGLPPAMAMRGIHVIEGRPSPSADMLVAICKGSPACKYFRMVESTPNAATYETWRVGDPEPTSWTYTMEDAHQAGIAAKAIWQKYPRNMLRARCSAELARMVYPDLTMGLYIPDEAEEIPAAVAAPPDPRAATERRVRHEAPPAIEAPEPEAEERLRQCASLIDRMRALPKEVVAGMLAAQQDLCGTRNVKAMALTDLMRMHMRVDEYETAMREQAADGAPGAEPDPFVEQPALMDVAATGGEGHGA